MRHILILTSFLIIITLIGCGKKIPKAGSRDTGYSDDTLLVMAVENKSGNPIQNSIIFEPRNSSGNLYCWIRGRCKNIKHSFTVSGNFEIICCLRPGEYTLKEVNYSRIDRQKYTLGKLKLNEKIKIEYGDLVLLNKKIITGVGAGSTRSVAGENRIYTSNLTTIEKKTILSDLSKINNFDSWKIKNQTGWNSKVTSQKPKKSPPKKPSIVLPKVTASPPKVVSQSEKPKTIIIPTGSLGEMSESRIKILEKTLESKLDDHFAIVPKELFEEAQEQAFQEMESDECTEDQCILMIKEILQIENAFKMDLISEDGDTQISITWNDQDQKRVEEDYCEGCKTKGLRLMIGGLVEKLVGK